MEPEPLYSKLCARIKQLLDLELLDGKEQPEIHLFAEFSSDTTRVDSEFRIEGGVVSTNSSFKALFDQSTVSVRWYADRDLNSRQGCYAQSNVILSFQPTRHMLLASNPDPGVLFVIGVRGTYRISFKEVRLGTCDETRDIGSQINFAKESGGKAEWDIQTDNRDLDDIGATFHETFGSDKVRLSFRATKVTTAALLCEEILYIMDETRGGKSEPRCAFSLTSREQQLVDSARKQLLARGNEPDLFALQSGSTIFRLHKSSLASHSPAFAACFQNPQCQEVQNNCYVIPDSTPEALESLVVYCENFLVPDINKHALELTKHAHVYQMSPLLKLCELYLLDEVSRFAASNLEELQSEFPKFLEICSVASLYELPLLLVQLHFVIVVVDEKIIHVSEFFAKWRQFLMDTPDFAMKRMQALATIRMAEA